MATSKPLEPMFRSLFRSSRPQPSRYVCAPCLHQQSITQRRNASASAKKDLPVPQPTPFVPDVETFLKLIGRDLSAQISKIPSWQYLFTASSEKMKEAGIEPARSRRYILRWRDKFRRGIYGPGGDFTFVKDGKAYLRVIEVPSLHKNGESAQYSSINSTPGMTKLVLNVPESNFLSATAPRTQRTSELKKPSGYKLNKDGQTISGPYALPMKGTNGSGVMVEIVEGMWEDRQGKKVFGGERRRAETLHKLGVAEHRKEAGTAR